MTRPGDGDPANLTGAGIALGAGLGMVVGLLVAGGTGIALGAAFGAGGGLIVASAVSAIRSRR